VQPPHLHGDACFRPYHRNAAAVMDSG
jgi:hypothetical protein